MKNNLDRKKTFKDRTSLISFLLVCVFVLTLTVGYAALNKEVKITSEGKFKVVHDVRITDISKNEVKGLALENYEGDYGKDSVKIGVKLPQLDSSITYKVEIANTGTVAQWVDSISEKVNNNSDIEYTFIDFNTRQLIYPGEVKDFYLKIKYKDGVSSITNDSVDFLLVFNFVTPTSTLALGNAGESSGLFYNGSIAKNKVESISFLPTLDVGDNAIGYWDASYDKDKTVIAWYTDNDSNGLYELNLGGIGKIYAPFNSDSLFKNFTNLKNITFNGYFDTSKATMMSNMFYNCTSLSNLNLSSFTTNKVTTMSNMFYNCEALGSINVSGFDTTKVVDMAAMFYNCKKIENINLSSFDTPLLTNIMNPSTDNTSQEGIFENCESLKSIDLSNFNTKNITDMSSMFNGCKALTSLNLSAFDTSKVTTMSNMFNNCTSLEELNISGFTTEELSEANDMFTLVPQDTLILVKNNDIKTWVLSLRSDFTNVKLNDEL